MPSLYAHYTFGQRVRKLLPEEMQVCISMFEDQYNLGLQGPDVLFFYRPLKMNGVRYLGHKIHKKPVACYFRKMIPEAKEAGLYSAETAYLLGFLCHFMLDSRVHPYVNRNILETGIKHVDMEGEFEKYLMYRDWYRPEEYPVWKHVPVTDSIFDTLHRMYPWMPGKKVAASACYFRFCKWILTAQCPMKKKMLVGWMRASGLYEKLKGHFIWDELNEKAIPVSEGFVKLYDDEVKHAASMEEWLWNAINSDKKVKYPARFKQNFDGVIL